MKTREDKIYNFFGHLVMTILTLLAIIPILLMFISSLTDNATLLQNGYSFLPEKWSTYAYERSSHPAAPWCSKPTECPLS